MMAKSWERLTVHITLFLVLHKCIAPGLAFVVLHYGDLYTVRLQFNTRAGTYIHTTYLHTTYYYIHVHTYSSDRSIRLQLPP